MPGAARATPGAVIIGPDQGANTVGPAWLSLPPPRDRNCPPSTELELPEETLALPPPTQAPKIPDATF